MMESLKELQSQAWDVLVRLVKTEPYKSYETFVPKTEAGTKVKAELDALLKRIRGYNEVV